MSDVEHTPAFEPFAPCPQDCEVPADIHRHFEREPGAFFALATPMPCCGREWARADEVLVLDQCRWCREDGKPLPGMILYRRPPTAAR